MGLAESLTKIAELKPMSCTLGKIIEQLPDNEKYALLEALDSEMITDEIYKALRMNGYKISNTTIREHRKKNCQCYWGTK